MLQVTRYAVRGPSAPPLGDNGSLFVATGISRYAVQDQVPIELERT